MPLTHSVALTHQEVEIAVRVTVRGTGDYLVDLGDVQHAVTWREGTWWVDATKVQARTARHGDALLFRPT